MSGNFKKEDLRVKKTRKFLQDAMLTLLERRNFRQITVHDLCEEALICRATFYMHFKDKYDLLEVWSQSKVREIDNNESAIQIIDRWVYGNLKIIRNIVVDADAETMQIIHNYLSSVLLVPLKEAGRNRKTPEYAILNNFLIGGLVQSFLWQSHRKQYDERQTKEFFHALLNCVFDWYNQRH